MRMGQFIANDMTAVRLTPPFRMVAVGSPDYLMRHGTPLQPEDLQSHACLRLRRTAGGASPWRLVIKGRPLEIVVQGPLIAGDFPTLLDAAIDGVGLAQVPEPVAVAPIKSGQLLPILADFAPETPGVFLYYPDRRQVLPKLRAFIDHVKAQLPRTPSLEAVTPGL
jgi:DNA-binding transcriptional LysR family regulator